MRFLFLFATVAAVAGFFTASSAEDTKPVPSQEKSALGVDGSDDASGRPHSSLAHGSRVVRAPMPLPTEEKSAVGVNGSGAAPPHSSLVHGSRVVRAPMPLPTEERSNLGVDGKTGGSDAGSSLVNHGLRYARAPMPLPDEEDEEESVSGVDGKTGGSGAGSPHSSLVYRHRLIRAPAPLPALELDDVPAPEKHNPKPVEIPF